MMHLVKIREFVYAETCLFLVHFCMFATFLCHLSSFLVQVYLEINAYQILVLYL